MTTIREEDFVQSVADAFQFISYYHPVDYIRDLYAAYQREESPAAKDAMAQILINSRMAAEGHRPICQDTGIAIAFIKVGMDVRWDTKKSLEELVNEGVRRAYTDKDNPLRASMLADPDGKRKSTGDNTPGGHARGARARRQGRGDRRRQGRRLGEQVASSRCCCRPTRSSTGCSRSCRPWARTGARPACSRSASAARPRRRC